MNLHRADLWTPSSWRSLAAAQQPSYPDEAALQRVLDRVKRLPPLVSSGEVDSLRALLAEAAEGKRFLLQGGDCAERFQDCHGDAVTRKLKILLQMSLVLTYGARQPVIRVGRIAGQFAKPRSSDTEVVDGRELATYRGDNVNDFAPDPVLRQPDPERLEQGYFRSVATLNYIRALLDGGFANLKSPEHWQLDFLPEGGPLQAYRDIAERIRDALDYFESLGSVNSSVRSVDFFTSHEGLLLPYEEALTRPGEGGGNYNLGAHFLWIGERTRQLDGAHVEYFRGLKNPIGVKVGGSITSDGLKRLAATLDPDRVPGRLTLITRFGHTAIAAKLPSLVRAMKEEGRTPVWSCDPMHGNTAVSGTVKTRDFKHVVAELTTAFEVHRAEGTRLGGVHFELTGENVTECIGGAEGLEHEDLSRSYETGCDPRLNYAQSMEIAFLISNLLRPPKGAGG